MRHTDDENYVLDEAEVQRLNRRWSYQPKNLVDLVYSLLKSTAEYNTSSGTYQGITAVLAVHPHSEELTFYRQDQLILSMNLSHMYPEEWEPIIKAIPLDT